MCFSFSTKNASVKVFKIFKTRLEFKRGREAGSWLQLTSIDPKTLPESDRLTAEYDRIATTTCSICVYPLVIGLAVYSLVYYNYKSWWSWAVSSLADSVYTFGFIALTPQLYINYKYVDTFSLSYQTGALTN